MFRVQADAAVREALDALAEPTTAMRDAGVKAGPRQSFTSVGGADSRFPMHPTEAADVWRAVPAEARRGMVGDGGRGGDG